MPAVPDAADSGSAGAQSSPIGLGRLFAVVVNYATPADTRRAVDSVLAANRPVDELIVVDNSASTHPGMLSDLPSRVRYCPAVRNLGFAGGVNVGIRQALTDGAAAVLLVNSDAYLEPDTLSALEATLLRHRDAGIAGPLIRAPRSRTVTSRGIAYDTRTARMRDRAALRIHAAGSTTIDVVDAVNGSVMLIKRAVFERIGLFDEPYFFGFEDIDFCLTAARAGFVSVIVNGATAWHEGGRSIGPDSPRRLYFAARNHLRLASRVSAGRGTRSLLQSLAIVGLNVAHAAHAPGGSMAKRLAAVLAGTRDHVMGRYGPGPTGME
jgi:GT2 family glycosyltransferase